MQTATSFHVALASVFAVSSASAQSALHTIQGQLSPSAAGAAVAFLPDVDGDGVRDFAVGSPLEAPSGVVRVHSGADGSVLRVLAGSTPDAQFGAALAVVADVDGGGLPDLMIGAPGASWSHSNQGAACVHSLETGLRWAQIFGSGTNSRMGHAVASIGDVDGDGVDDFAAGEPGADFGGLVDNGAVTVVSGGTLQFLATLRGNESGEQFGFALSSWGDLDADGLAEWLVGAPFHSSHGQGGGRVVAISGGSHAPLWSLFGGHQDEHFGMALAGLGDLDGDGALDFVVGAPDFDWGVQSCGRIAWFSGLSVDPSEEQVGQDGERLGRSLATLDWDGDGALEIAAGAPRHAAGALGRVGAVRLFDARDLTPRSTLVGSALDGEFGFALAGGADLNADGVHELLVGARAEFAHCGVARLLLGALPTPQPYCTAKITSVGCTPRIAATGAASLSLGDGLRVFAGGVSQNVPGLLFLGAAPHAAPFRGGTLCVSQPVQRTPVQTSTAGAAGCSGMLSYTLTPARLAHHGFAAGDVAHAQFWWRDTGFAAPNNVGLSDALAFVVAP